MTDRRQALLSMADTAKKMLAGMVGPIEGARRIVSLSWAVGDDDNRVLDPFRGIDSESDDLVVGDRSLWARAYLDDMDRRYAAYEAVLQPGIAADCEALLALVEPILHECPSCGFSPLAELPYDTAGEPSYESCPCCDFQPGVTDEIGYDSAEWRKRWIARGMQFCRPPIPIEWNAAEQLNRVGLSS